MKKGEHLIAILRSPKTRSKILFCYGEDRVMLQELELVFKIFTTLRLQ